MPRGPTEKPVEHAGGTARHARIEPVQIVDRVVHAARHVQEQAHLVVPVLGHKSQLRRPTRPRLPAPATQPQRTQRQMLDPIRHAPVRGGTALLAGHRRSRSLACCSNSRHHTWVSNGGSAGRACHCDDVHPGSGRRYWSAIALRETYTVMPAPPFETVSGGLAGGKASPPPHHGGWEQPAGHPPTQPSWQYAGEASTARVRGRHAMALAVALGKALAFRRSRRSSPAPWRAAAIAFRPPTPESGAPARSASPAERGYGDVPAMHSRCTCKHAECRYDRPADNCSQREDVRWPR